MPDQKIQVFAYSGYRADEIPRSFILNTQKIDIIDILDMWIEERNQTMLRKRFYRVSDKDGFMYTLYHDEKKSDWFLQSKG